MFAADIINADQSVFRAMGFFSMAFEKIATKPLHSPLLSDVHSDPRVARASLLDASRQLNDALKGDKSMADFLIGQGWERPKGQYMGVEMHRPLIRRESEVHKEIHEFNEAEGGEMGVSHFFGLFGDNFFFSGHDWFYARVNGVHYGAPINGIRWHTP